MDANGWQVQQVGPMHEISFGMDGGMTRRLVHEDGRMEETRLPAGPYAWVPHGEREWWYEWTGPKEPGVTYPPLFTFHLGTSDCVNLYAYSNGEHPDDKNADPDYIHICDVDDFIGLLETIKPLVPES